MIIILECSTALLPVWVERQNLNEPSFEHRGACLPPVICVGQVEDEQVFRCRSWHDWMDTTACELKVVVQIRSTQHDAIEPIVVLKPSNLHEAKPLAVHTDRAVEGADRSSDSELGWHDPEVGERSNFHAHRRASTGLCKAQRSRARPRGACY